MACLSNFWPIFLEPKKFRPRVPHQAEEKQAKPPKKCPTTGGWSFDIIKISFHFRLFLLRDHHNKKHSFEHLYENW